MRWLSLMLALLAVAGCRRGPDTEELQAQLQQVLDEDYEAGLFLVDGLWRKGVYPFRAEGDDRARLLVYYDAELSFQRDRRLSDWDSVGVGSLVGVLGATPLGVSGVQVEGNRSGDELHVYGALAFAREEDAWIPVALEQQPGGAITEITAPEDMDEALELTSRQRRLRRLEQVGAYLDRVGPDEQAASFEQDLERFVVLQECAVALRDGRPSVATGLPFGAYAALGDALGEVLRRSDREPCLLPTAGSVENCERVQRGEVAFGLAQGDVAAMARAGAGMFEGQGRMVDLRAACALYPEAVQIVVSGASGIVALDDLRGRRVDLGAEGSGIRVNALQVLQAAGISLDEIGRVHGRATGEALAALERGEVDAVFVTSAFPTRALAELSAREPQRWLSLPQRVVDDLVRTNPALVEVTLPAHTYPGQAQPCSTVGVTSLLITHEGIADAAVTEVLSALLDNVGELGGSTPEGWYVSRETARTGASIPLHPAAERYLESN
jgi:TRAP transporter TAXI family solute receptor